MFSLPVVNRKGKSPQANNGLACLSVCANSILFEVLKLASGLKGHYYTSSCFIAKWHGPVSFVSLWNLNVPCCQHLRPFPFKLWAGSSWNKTLSAGGNRQYLTCNNIVSKITSVVFTSGVFSTISCCVASLPEKEIRFNCLFLITTNYLSTFVWKLLHRKFGLFGGLLFYF